MTTPVNPADPEGRRPIPDPTVLTTDQLLREIAHLKELFGEQLTRVDDKLALAERQRVEQKSDTEKAIQAALLAQKESVAAQADAFEKSVAKSEAATTKQIDQIQTTFKSEIGAVIKSHDELRERVLVNESTLGGAKEQKQETRAVSAGMNAAIGLGVAVFVALLTVVGILLAGG